MQLTPNGPELLGQVALELLRLDKNAHQATAEKVLKTPGADNVPSLVAVRIALGLPQPKVTTTAKGKKEVPSTEPLRAKVEGEVLKGNAAAAKDMARKGSRDDRPWALTAGGMAALDSNAAEAAEMLTEAAGLLEGNTSPAVNWVAIRVCRGLGKLGKFEPADKLANPLTDEQAKAWAKLEVVRGRLADKKGDKADDSGPTRSATRQAGGRVKARRWPGWPRTKYDDRQGVAKGRPPFGLAGIVLGRDVERVGDDRRAVGSDAKQLGIPFALPRPTLALTPIIPEFHDPQGNPRVPS